jgi:pSer/pThr/pTyr-binding forkhead associated (FHA) protein
MPRVTITIVEKGPQPYRFDLKREIVTIGRGLDNDIVVACGSVSGKHSEMRRVEGGYHLVDVGSTNGIKVDGVRQQKVSLKNGMTVKLGDVEFGFTLNEEELAIIDAEIEALGEEEENEVEFSEKKVSEMPKEAEKDDQEEEDDLDKLPELRPDKSKEKEDQEAVKQKKAEDKEREKRQEKADKEEKAQQKLKDQRSERRKKRESSDKLNEKDEYSESKAVTIGSGFILFTLIAAATTFFYGASTRHEKDTGEKLLKGIVNKENAKKDAPTDVDNKDKSKDGGE